MTTGFRTLFLATEPTWDGWLDALRENWVVAVRHDAVSGQQDLDARRLGRGASTSSASASTTGGGGTTRRSARPLVSVVAVRPGDGFEAARPERGVTIRVRCAWENTPQGLPRKPITELVTLTVDGAAVAPVLVATKRRRGALLADHYHRFDLADPAPGPHFAEAVVRTVNGKVESRLRDRVHRVAPPENNPIAKKHPTSATDPPCPTCPALNLCFNFSQRLFEEFLALFIVSADSPLCYSSSRGTCSSAAAHHHCRPDESARPPHNSASLPTAGHGP